MAVPLTPPPARAHCRGSTLQLRPLISAANASNITITGGNGTIDGNGWFAWPSANWSSPECGEHRHCAGRTYFGNSTHTLIPPHAVTFVNCSGVTVANVTITNPAFWGLQVCALRGECASTNRRCQCYDHMCCHHHQHDLPPRPTTHQSPPPPLTTTAHRQRRSPMPLPPTTTLRPSLSSALQARSRPHVLLPLTATHQHDCAFPPHWPPLFSARLLTTTVTHPHMVASTSTATTRVWST